MPDNSARRPTSDEYRIRAAGEGYEEVRARWPGHRLHAELDIVVDPGRAIAQAHASAAEVRHQLLQEIAQIVCYFFWQDFMHMSYSVLHVFPA